MPLILSSSNLVQSNTPLLYRSPPQYEIPLYSPVTRSPYICTSSTLILYKFYETYLIILIFFVEIIQASFDYLQI